MNRKMGAVAVLFLLLLLPLGQVNANSGGKFNSSNGCGCHGGKGGVTAQLTGVPTAYEAQTTYTLTMGMSTTPSIAGFNLDVNRGSLSNGDANTQVSSNGRQATHGYSPGTTSWTVDWTAPASGSGSVLFKLAVLSGNGNGGTSGDDHNTYSISITEEVSTNADPVASNVLIAPSTPDTTDDLTVSYTYSDDDGDAESGTTVTWFKDGASQPAYTALTLPSTATAKGETWHAVITPSDGEDAGAPVASPTVSVLNRAPDVLNLAVSDEAPDTNDDVSFSFQTNDADGDAIAFTESRWLLDDVHVGTLDNSSTLPAIATRAGDTWVVEVRAADATDIGEWVSSADIVVGTSNQGPEITDLAVMPTAPNTGDNLTVSWTATDPEGDDIVDTMLTWALNGEHVPAADGLNPLPSSFTQRGDAWTVDLQASDGQAWGESAATTVNIVNAAPVVDALLESPTFSALHDVTVAANITDADGDQTVVERVDWYRNGELASVSTSETLPSTNLNRGEVWHAVVVVSDGTDSTEFTTPAITVENARPQAVVTWPENPTSLTDLVATIETEDADGDAIVVSTTWYKNGFRDASLTNATVVQADRLAPEQTWRLVVVASDGTETSDSIESTITLVNLEPTATIQLLSSNVWYNETTVLSGAASSDPDGTDLRYDWTWATGSSTGETLALVLMENTVVTLTITDEHGATHQTDLSLDIAIGPDVRNLQVINDDRGNVRLSWSWTGEQAAFNVLRNGVLVGSTNATDYEDQPPISGTVTYTVQPSKGRTSKASISNAPRPIPSPVAGPGSSALMGSSIGLMESLAPR